MKCKNKALKNAYIIYLSSKKGAEYNIIYIISNKTFFPSDIRVSKLLRHVLTG